MPDALPTIPPSTIAQLTLRSYAALPKNLKPTVRSNGIPEWTILASIVLSLPILPVPAAVSTLTPQHDLRLISLGSGVKCLPTNRLPPCGDTLHDSHAEVLAKRGLGRYLAEEAIALSKGGGSEVLEAVEEHRENAFRFRMRKGVGVHLYVSALPCGNASTLYTAAHQPKAMAVLKESTSSSRPPAEIEGPPASATSRGRNGYTNTSSLRTKPGRPDSFPSISMSCSDKIASWNVLGLQGGLLGRWIEPVYLDSVVIGGVGDAPAGQGEFEGGDVVGWKSADGETWEEAIKAEVEEALYGRLETLEPHLHAPFRLARPAIHLTPLLFPFDKPTISSLHPGSEPSPQPTSVLHYLSPQGYTTEHLFNGCDRRVSWKPPGLVPIEERRRSGVCKLEMMRAGARLEDCMSGGTTVEVDGERRKARGSYYDKKQGTAYQSVKALLRGVAGPPRLIPGFEKCGPLSSTEAPQLEEIGGEVKPPFTGWIVSGAKWESFDEEGEIKT